MNDVKSKTEIVRITDPYEKQRIAHGVLEALRAWFEVDASREKYIAECAGMTFLAAKDGDEYAGFLCLRETGRDTVEIAVMGVLKAYHRRGLGRALFESARKIAAEAGYSFMQVKTVQTGIYEEYDATNRFYLLLRQLYSADEMRRIKRQMQGGGRRRCRSIGV